MNATKEKLNNGKYVIGKVKKKMPTLSDFQKKLDEREVQGISRNTNSFLRGNSLEFLIVKAQYFQMKI